MVLAKYKPLLPMPKKKKKKIGITGANNYVKTTYVEFGLSHTTAKFISTAPQN